MRPYEKLVAWQEAFKLCLWIYQTTATFPPEEKFALVSQMRRSSYSVPMNVAEGNVKHSSREKAHFFETSLGSLEELHCQCRIALGLRYISEKTFEEADQHIHRVSYLITRLRSSVL